jgi:L-fuconolactonase
MTLAIDAHQHFWNTSRVPLPWLREEHAPIAGPHGPADLEPLLGPARVGRTILVQSACSDADTDSMFEHVERHDWIAGVVAWLPLESPARTAARLDVLSGRPKLRGVRHLIHDEADPHWIMQRAVFESLELVAAQGLVLELPAVFPRHLGDVPALAQAFPTMTIVIDHLGKPPLDGRPDGDELRDWARQIEEAAAHPNVAAKISGLNTAVSRSDWSSADFVPAVRVAVETFGPERLMCGSDWPVALLNGDFERVWAETRRTLDVVAPQHQYQMLAGTARRLYRLAEVPVGAH